MTRLTGLVVALVFSAALPAQAVTFTHSSVACATTSTSVLAAGAIKGNGARVIFQNDSDTTIYLAIDGNAAALNAGLRVNANGGNVFLDQGAPSGAINCIHGSSGTKKLLVTYE